MISKEIILNRLSGLLRTRVLLAIFGMIVISIRPEIAEWITALVGLALGVSAIDALRVKHEGGKNG